MTYALWLLWHSGGWTKEMEYTMGDLRTVTADSFVAVHQASNRGDGSDWVIGIAVLPVSHGKPG